MNSHMITLLSQLLMKCRTRQICLSSTDSGYLILQQETETTQVTKCPPLLYSQPAGLGRLAELLTGDVEHSADILADVRDFAFDACEVLLLLH